MVQAEIQQKQVLYREGKMRPEDFESLHRYGDLGGIVEFRDP